MARYLTWSVLALLGLGGAYLAWGFGWGQGPRIGSAAVPLVLSCGLALVALWGLASPAEGGERGPVWRPFGAVVAAVVLFIVTVDLLGLVPATLLCMCVAYLGQIERRYVHFLLYAVPFAVAVWALFTVGLGLPVPAFGGW